MADLNSNAQKWVDALRSGKYKQGQKALTVIAGDEELDCCLGVACKVAIENGLELETHTEFKSIGFGAEIVNKHLRFYDHSSYGTLPTKVAIWLGLSTNDGTYTLPGNNNSCVLTSDNDSGVPFDQIAATIESQPEGLFVS
jgi:hypothetical protein